MDDGRRGRVVRALTARAECLSHGAVYAWQCWCPSCAANIVREYERDPDNRGYSLLPSVHARVKAAVGEGG
jgi:hypothetical protein